MSFTCDKCNKPFKTKHGLEYHITNNICHNERKKFCCKYCKQGFTCKSNMYRHMNSSCRMNNNNDTSDNNNNDNNDNNNASNNNKDNNNDSNNNNNNDNKNNKNKNNKNNKNNKDNNNDNNNN